MAPPALVSATARAQALTKALTEQSSATGAQLFRDPEAHVTGFAGDCGLRSALVAARSVADGALLVFELRDNRGETHMVCTTRLAWLRPLGALRRDARARE